MGFHIDPYNLVRLQSWAEVDNYYRTEKPVRTRNKDSYRNGRIALDMHWRNYRGGRHIKARETKNGRIYRLYDWGDQPTVTYYPNGVIIVRPWWNGGADKSLELFVNRLQPYMFELYRYGLYLIKDGKYYRVPTKGLRISPEGKPLNPMQEYRLELNRERAKAVRERVKELVQPVLTIEQALGIDGAQEVIPSKYCNDSDLKAIFVSAESSEAELKKLYGVALYAGAIAAKQVWDCNKRMWVVVEPKRFSKDAMLRYMYRRYYKLMGAYDERAEPVGSFIGRARA